MGNGENRMSETWPWGQHERPAEIKILYEDEQVEMEGIPLTRDSEPRGLESISYRPETDHWYVERRQQNGAGDEEIRQLLLPRERVFSVIGYLRPNSIQVQEEFGDSEWQQLRYDGDTGFRDIPNENEELLTPITFESSTEHWQCVVRDLKNLEKGEPIVTHRIIPREKVVRVA